MQLFYLVDNYRSAACILGAAQRLISANNDWDRRQLRAMLPALNYLQVRATGS
jgi:superfamily I DNA/RNA helicase